MDLATEESTSLKPGSPPESTGIKSNLRVMHFSRERRLEIVRLGKIYYVSWLMLILIAALIPIHEWFLIPRPECWSSRYTHMAVSVLIALLTGSVSLLLAIVNCVTRVTVSYWRLNFCTLCFIVLTILTILNFLIAVFFFSLHSCYFAQITPADQMPPVRDWFWHFTAKYDLKLVAVWHILSCLFSFFTGIGFAIIKNNFKYIRQVDIE